MFTTYCPDCDARIQISPEVEVGTILECPTCGVALEVISLEPLELDLALGFSIDYDPEDKVDEWDKDLEHDDLEQDDLEIQEDIEEEEKDDWEDEDWDEDWEDEDWDEEDWDEEDDL